MELDVASPGLTAGSLSSAAIPWDRQNVISNAMQPINLPGFLIRMSPLSTNDLNDCLRDDNFSLPHLPSEVGTGGVPPPPSSGVGIGKPPRAAPS